MTQKNLTQNSASGPRPNSSGLVPGLRHKPRLFLFGAVLLFLAVAGGTAAGFRSGYAARQDYEARQGSDALQEQFNLGVEDLGAGRYEIARQRFEWILSHQPGYPEAEERLLAALVGLGATPTPRATRTPAPPTPTTTTAPPGPTATLDTRPLENLLRQAGESINAGDWTGAVEAIVELRSINLAYKAAEVDGLLYLALRNRGVDRIYKESNLGGGSFDLTLAERFGPLDNDAVYARNVARLYLYGAGFVGADPERAVYYFSQLNSMAPYLRDGTRMNSRERYRTALIEYGSLLMSTGQPCQAQTQLELAAGIRSDDSLQAALDAAALACSPPTPTPEPEPSPTPGQ
jgi:hypothetical protein